MALQQPGDPELSQNQQSALALNQQSTKPNKTVQFLGTATADPKVPGMGGEAAMDDAPKPYTTRLGSMLNDPDWVKANPDIVNNADKLKEAMKNLTPWKNVWNADGSGSWVPEAQWAAAQAAQDAKKTAQAPAPSPAPAPGGQVPAPTPVPMGVPSPMPAAPAPAASAYAAPAAQAPAAGPTAFGAKVGSAEDELLKKKLLAAGMSPQMIAQIVGAGAGAGALAGAPIFQPGTGQTSAAAAPISAPVTSLGAIR